MQKTTMSSAKSRRATDESEEEAIVYAITGIAKLLFAEFRQIAAAHNVSDSLAGALWQIHRAGQIKASDLARAMSCDTGNLSGSLDRLESVGLVERVTSASDRRVRLLQLTKAGHKLTAQMKERFRGLPIHAELSRMSPRERSVLSEALTRLSASMSRAEARSVVPPTLQLRRIPA